jgi:hypothetical protein
VTASIRQSIMVAPLFDDRTHLARSITPQLSTIDCEGPSPVWV